MRKKNLNKVPQKIIEQINTFDQDDVVVASVKRIKKDEVDKYKKLGLVCKEGGLVIPVPFLPDPSAGKYSKANVEGWEHKRKDLPKVSKEVYCGERPIYGDWSKGSFSLWQTRKVYRVDFYPPKEVLLTVELLETKTDSFLVKFSIEQVINKRTPEFKKELLYNLNLLQENVGTADVFPSTATLAEYKKTVNVDWEILPPGTVDEVVEAMVGNKKTVKATPEQIETMRQRIKLMSELEPEAYIKGTSGFLRYFGAQFGDDFVVFENIRYGNAIYVMYESWKELSQKSRTELLNGPDDSFDRIEHVGDWEERLKSMVDRYRYTRS